MALKYYDCKTNLKVDLKRLTLKAEGCCRGAAEGCSGTATCRVSLRGHWNAAEVFYQIIV